MQMDPSWKKAQISNIEKWTLRNAFSKSNIIPDSVLWRQKNGMSDAVGYDWVSYIKKYASKTVEDDDSTVGKYLNVKNPPTTKEELMYRVMYTKLFNEIDCTPHIWRPKWVEHTDPSGAFLDKFICSKS